MKKKKEDEAEEEGEVYIQMRIFQSVGSSILSSSCCTLNPSPPPLSLCPSTTPTPCSSVPSPVPAPPSVPGRRAPLFNAWYLTDAWYHWLGWFATPSPCVCMYVCVCERERVRQRMREWEREWESERESECGCMNECVYVRKWVWENKIQSRFDEDLRLQSEVNQTKTRCRPSNMRKIPQQQSSTNVLLVYCVAHR